MSHDDGRWVPPSDGRRDEIGDGPAARQHEQSLRRILQSEVSMVRPAGDGLAKIRARTARRGWRTWYTPALVGVTALAVVTAVLWGTGVIHAPSAPAVAGQPTTSSAAPTTPSQASQSPHASQGSPSPQPSSTSTSGPPQPRSLPVYYVGAQDVGAAEEPATRLVLFREYHALSATDDRNDWVRASLDEMFAGPATDPDYRASPWPATAHVLNVDIDEGWRAITVNIGGIADLRTASPPAGMQSATAAAIAVQQIVYDVTAAANADESFSAGRVVILADGAPLATLWGETVEYENLRDAAATGAIWIETPREGATVGSSVTVSGEALFFEAQGQWTLTAANGSQVAAGFAQTPAADAKGPFEIDLGTLAPGSYTIKVYDLGGLGIEGRGPVDTKTFTVR